MQAQKTLLGPRRTLRVFTSACTHRLISCSDLYIEQSQGLCAALKHQPTARHSHHTVVAAHGGSMTCTLAASCCCGDNDCCCSRFDGGGYISHGAMYLTVPFNIWEIFEKGNDNREDEHEADCEQEWPCEHSSAAV